ncbi:hypothetical protein AAFC00_001634 [Neodothiora populina]|uniref:Major facilitator superfamily (MFS) profile domain-containing protein n=1 Tax=Neodothiora populina TaxID=2781224 RepID=A0ABR3PPN0_9PEZI
MAGTYDGASHRGHTEPINGAPSGQAAASAVQETTPLLGASKKEILDRTYNDRSPEGAEDADDESDGDATATEDTPALESGDTATEGKKEHDTSSVFGIISVLLLGVFVSQADTTLVMATFASIASDFGKLELGSWLLSSYLLASCVTQPMYGKLSDIFGRKGVLQTSYATFALGTLFAGLAQNMTQMIVGRVIQGAAGAGMVSMVSILLTDLVPLQEVAVYRSYVNIFTTVGRSCGGLIGGYLAQAVGWRWAFLCQCPLLLISIGLVWWRLEEPTSVDKRRTESTLTKWKRIDFVGSFFMSLTVLPMMLAFDMVGQEISWQNPVLLGLLGGAIVSGVCFCLTERYWAKEPIFPLKLLGHYVVVTSYVQIVIQTAIQVGLMYLVPLYFQVTKNAATGEAGAHLVPSIIGNTIGGLAVGAFIKRTGKYKLPIILSSISTLICFTLLSILWRGSSTSVASSLVIFFAGLGTGMAHSAIFVGLTAGIEKENIAIATSGMYLSGNIGSVAGVSGAGAVFQSSLRWRLNRALSRESDGSEIIKKVLSNVSALHKLHGRIHDVVVQAFVDSIQTVFHVALVLAALGLFVGAISRQVKILR